MFASSSSSLVADRELDGNRCVVRLIGELDRRAAPGLRAFLDEQCILSEEIVLDLAKLSLIDASGIGAILDAHKKCADMGGVLTTTAASPEVEQVLQRVLQITGLERIGPFESEAVDWTAPSTPSLQSPFGGIASPRPPLDLRRPEDTAFGDGAPQPGEKPRFG